MTSMAVVRLGNVRHRLQADQWHPTTRCHWHPADDDTVPSTVRYCST
jgi:hypothetical protein